MPTVSKIVAVSAATDVPVQGLEVQVSAAVAPPTPAPAPRTPPPTHSGSKKRAHDDLTTSVEGLKMVNNRSVFHYGSRGPVGDLPTITDVVEVCKLCTITILGNKLFIYSFLTLN